MSGQTATHNRGDYETREQLLRLAHAVVEATGMTVGQGHLRKLVLRYRHQVDRDRWGFVDYLSNALVLTAQQRLAVTADSRVIEYADPTGEAAVRNVMRTAS